MSGPQATMRRRHRIIFSIDSMEPGGTELNALRTATRLDRDRFEVHVVCLKDGGPLRDDYAEAGIPVSVFGISNLYGPRAIATGLRLRRYLAELHADVVHCHDMYSNVFTLAWARMAGVGAVLASRRWWTSLPHRKYRLANRLAFRLADRVIVNSAAVAASVARDDGIRPSRIRTVPNFVDDDLFDAALPEAMRRWLHDRGIPTTGPLIGIVARLSPVKDHHTLLQAVALLRHAHPDAQVVIAGEGPLRRALEEEAVALGVAKTVHFLGHVPGAGRLHAAFDVSVLCSTSEGSPNAVVEAMATGRPVVATAVGGTVDAVEEGRTGYLIPPGAPEALANALRKLLDDPEGRAAMGSAARAMAKERYRADRVVAGLEQVYHEVLQ